MKPSEPDKLPPVYVIFGGEPFLEREAVEKIIRDVLGDDRDKMAIAEFDGDGAELADVLDECRSMSLLCSTRLVFVRDADPFISEHREALEKYLESPSPTGVLVLICTRWDKGWRLYKRVQEVGRNVECKPMRPRDVPDWLAGRAKTAYGCTLHEAAGRRLLDFVGPELSLLDMELAKLATFVHPKKIVQAEDVDRLVGATRVEKVFAITDAVAARDAATALDIWDQIVGGDPDGQYRAVGGLAYGFRKLAEMKRLLGQGVPAVEAARQVGEPWHAAELKRQTERFTLRQWRQHLVKLLQIDMAAKSGLGTVQSSVEKLIVELCAAS